MGHETHRNDNRSYVCLLCSEEGCWPRQQDMQGHQDPKHRKLVQDRWRECSSWQKQPSASATNAFGAGNSELNTPGPDNPGWHIKRKKQAPTWPPCRGCHALCARPMRTETPPLSLSQRTTIHGCQGTGPGPWSQDPGRCGRCTGLR